MFFSGGQILGGNIQDSIDVDVERDFDLRNAALRRRNSFEIELPQQTIVVGHLPFPLEHADGDRSLIVGGSGERLLLFDRDGGIPFDERRHDAAFRFDSQRKRRHVKQHDVFDVAGNDSGLNGGADGDHRG